MLSHLLFEKSAGSTSKLHVFLLIPKKGRFFIGVDKKGFPEPDVPRLSGRSAGNSGLVPGAHVLAWQRRVWIKGVTLAGSDLRASSPLSEPGPAGHVRELPTLLAQARPTPPFFFSLPRREKILSAGV